MMLHNLWRASPLSTSTASQLIPLVRYASSQVGIKMDNLDVPSNLSLAPQSPTPAPRLIKKASEGSRIIPARLRPEFNVSLVIYDDIGRPIVNTLSFKDESVVNSLALDPSVFNAPLRKDILHRVVRWQLACRRSGNHKAKSRSETRGSTRKVRPQKGGGQARVGDLRYCLRVFLDCQLILFHSAPQWRGGYCVHGPVVRDHSYTLQKKGVIHVFCQSNHHD